MSDNQTAHNAGEYDELIGRTIPNYEAFHAETLDLVRTAKPDAKAWLDTGCGTGTLVERASVLFPEARFVLADPSVDMLAIAQVKLAAQPGLELVNLETRELAFPENRFDVITAIQCHHYLDREQRRLAVDQCFRMLKTGGLFVLFENIRPLTLAGTEIGLKRWAAFQAACGKPRDEADAHMTRFDREYFPITVEEHLALLRAAGFSAVELLWVSQMQAGFYAFK
ncbi:MAG: class I SAM-dependent methyltransferase [Solirubrobacterales bacterium]